MFLSKIFCGVGNCTKDTDSECMKNLKTVTICSITKFWKFFSMPSVRG